ncbi:vegetative incompatibility protein HET-E-1 [Nannizzia gypsea CBS 118893]|uniref:Vegetative incompatibility protein HET-E-1 n=1 Tax=Arthroderma gypseum (strain ATCC MYA-4604 / CBS 118893) TaxID=535722 RepID=E4V766_ARTGP|nr:vegetative incompatibility protein HET-E-1 [Nannizzia gypsea CBS 118893]EFQ96932.1 vegetative incompatibility protein HET-E-1 [Nannizzia gypsea CBS 118893]
MSVEALPAARIESFTAKDQSKVHIGDAYTVERDRCLEHLRITDPRHDKRRIERTAGGLLKDAYQWVLSCDEYHQWSDDPETRLLWIAGGPGMGKTMLLSGIIDEIDKSKDTINISFFFCQASDERINTATSVLRGLIYLLAKKQPSLTSHIKERYKDAGKSLFEGPNAWDALFEIFQAMLEDPAREKTVLILDALDECIPGDLQTLLDLIVETTSSLSSSRLKWIVSSRNDPAIEQRLRPGRSRVKLCLENNKEYVSRAVEAYTEHSISKLPIHNDEALRARIRDAIRQKADGRFLWVSFVMRELRGVSQSNMKQVVDETPRGLTDKYRQIPGKIRQQQDDAPGLHTLLDVVKAYRPLSPDELHHMCGPIDEIVYIIHRPAKHILPKVIFISKQGEGCEFAAIEGQRLVLRSEKGQDRVLFSRSLKAMSSTLKRNLRSWTSQHLAQINYLYLCWTNNLADYNTITRALKAVNGFLGQGYPHWIESLSLLQNAPDRSSIDSNLAEPPNAAIVDGSDRMVVHLWDLEAGERTRILRDRTRSIDTVAFPLNSSLIASGLDDTTASLWSLRDKSCIWVLMGHTKQFASVVFSANGSALATGSKDGKFRVGDIHRRTYTLVFAISNMLNLDWELSSPDEYIRTKTKIVALDSSLEDASPEETWGYNLSQDCRWIVWNSEKVLWLPTEFVTLSFDAAS